MGQTEPQLRQEVGRGQISLQAMSLGPVGIENQDRRCPLDAEAVEDIVLLLDVSAVGNEVLRDEGRDLGIGVDLGLQPSASPSHRRGGEVGKQRPAGLLRLAKRCVDVSLPGDFHRALLLPAVPRSGGLVVKASNSRAGGGARRFRGGDRNGVLL
jgi:hypothetical protein